MRKVVLSILLMAAFFGARYVRISASRSSVAPKPAPIATPTPNAPPVPQPAPKATEFTQAGLRHWAWPNHYAVSEETIPPRLMEDYHYQLMGTYPQLVSRKPEARRFNRWIKNKVLGYASQFRNAADAEQRNKMKTLPQLWGLELSFEVHYSNEQFISLVLYRDLMQTGQMHPINYYETINYDLRQGRQLRAKDVFKRGYLKSLSGYSRKYLQDQYELPDDDWFNRGTKPNTGNFLNWNLVPDGVLLSFEDYQVAPHSFGQPEFVVPFSALEGTTQPTVLRRLLVSQ